MYVFYNIIVIFKYYLQFSTLVEKDIFSLILLLWSQFYSLKEKQVEGDLKLSKEK